VRNDFSFLFSVSVGFFCKKNRSFGSVRNRKTETKPTFDIPRTPNDAAVSDAR